MSRTQYAAAALLIICMGYTQQDLAAHYILGDQCADFMGSWAVRLGGFGVGVFSGLVFVFLTLINFEIEGEQ